MRTLAIDDNESSLYMLEWMLRGNGHEVVTATNGEEALQELKKGNIDLIISDILMPVMDGFTLCRIVKSSDIYKGIPFIVYTATYTGPQDEELALKMGADGFIIKPCEPEEMIHKIELILTKRITDSPDQVEVKSEEEVLTLYNERLVRKLEQKMIQAEEEIIQRKTVEEKLLRSENLLQTTQQIGKIGGWEWDIAKQQIYWTEETFNIHDLDPDKHPINSDELIEQSFLCYNEADRQIVSDAFWKCVHTGESYEFEFPLTTHKGRNLFIRTAAKAMWEGGKICRVVGYIQDITVIKQAEMESVKLKEQLVQTQKLDSIGKLAGGVAHDFNNVLTIILGYGEEILTKLKPEDWIYHQVDEIVGAGKRALSLTKQLLAFGKKNLVKAEVLNPNSIVIDMQRMLLRIIGEDIKLKTLLAEDLAMIKADQSQIEQVILNLVLNAREAMPRGGEICISTENVSLNDDNQTIGQNLTKGDYVLLCVSDTGIGINEDTLHHIFEPFYTTKPDKGTGLGLSTVYGIVQQAKGDIFVKSDVGVGTIFKVYLPQTEEKEIESNSREQLGSLTSTGEYIFLVEDDPSIRKMIRKALTEYGYHVNLAENANQAIQMIETGFKPDVLITDIIMPGMSGLELAKYVNNLLPSVSVLLISGYADDNFRNQQDDYQHFSFLQKPFTGQSLAIQVKDLIIKQTKDISRKILMIDDDENIRILIKRSCEKRGHQMLGAHSFHSAQTALNKENFDLLLIDKNLPGEDGISILRRLRKQGFNAPAIILSGVLWEIETDLMQELNIVSSEEKDSNTMKLVLKIESLL